MRVIKSGTLEMKGKNSPWRNGLPKQPERPSGQRRGVKTDGWNLWLDKKIKHPLPKER